MQWEWWLKPNKRQYYGEDEWLFGEEWWVIVFEFKYSKLVNVKIMNKKLICVYFVVDAKSND